MTPLAADLRGYLSWSFIPSDMRLHQEDVDATGWMEELLVQEECLVVAHRTLVEEIIALHRTLRGQGR